MSPLKELQVIKNPLTINMARLEALRGGSFWAR
jgi:hypothetical protein